jgi:hypothetical protein
MATGEQFFNWNKPRHHPIFAYLFDFAPEPDLASRVVRLIRIGIDRLHRGERICHNSDLHQIPRDLYSIE